MNFKKLTLLALSGIFLLVIAVPSCKHELIYDFPDTPFDTTQPPPIDTVPIDTFHCDTCAAGVISFSEDVLPILISNCATSGCHDSITHKEDIIITNYQSLMSTTDIQGHLLNSDFWNKIALDKDMPPNEPLSNAQLQIIQAWLQQGAQNTTCSHHCECDSTNMSFTNNIYPIIQTYCIGCHKPGSLYGGVDLTGYNKIMIEVNNGRLLKTIKHETGYGIVGMPYGSSKFNDCTIAKIENWIKSGAPNN